jgi:xanthine dehydrogenase/oxidase
MTERVRFNPTSLQQLLDIKAGHPTAKLVAGNTEIGIEQRFANQEYPVLVNILAVPELQNVSFGSSSCSLGAAVPLTDLMSLLEGKLHQLKKEEV